MRHVLPDLATGDIVNLGQIGTAQPLWTGSPGAGQAFQLYVNVVNQEISLHLPPAHGLCHAAAAAARGRGGAALARWLC